MVPPEGHKVLSTLADMGGPGAEQPAGQARVLVGSASLLAAAGVKLSPDVEAHMASVQVGSCACTPRGLAVRWAGLPQQWLQAPAYQQRSYAISTYMESCKLATAYHVTERKTHFVSP